MAPDTSDDEETVTSEEPTAEDDATPVSTGTPRRTLSSRLSTAFLKPATPKFETLYKEDEDYGDEGEEEDEEEAAPTERPMTDAEKAEAIRKVDSTERKIGYIGAALIAVIGFVYFLPYVENPKKGVAQTINRTGKHCPAHYKDIVSSGVHQCVQYVYHSRSAWLLEMFIVLAFALFVVVATRIGKRSLLAFALLFSGLAVETLSGSIIGLGFLIGGGWLLVRAYRVQKYGTTSSKEVAQIAQERRAERTGRPPRQSSGRTTTSARTTKTTAKSKKGAAPQTRGDGRPKPQASKRYTPKAPPRKKPPPPE